MNHNYKGYRVKKQFFHRMAVYFVVVFVVVRGRRGGNMEIEKMYKLEKKFLKKKTKKYK